MRNNIRFFFALTSMLVYACGSEDPSFKTQSLGKYLVEVSEDPQANTLPTYSMESSSEEEGDLESDLDILLGEIEDERNEDFGESADAIADSKNGKDKDNNDGSKDDITQQKAQKGNGKKSDSSPAIIASNDSSSTSDDPAGADGPVSSEPSKPSYDTPSGGSSDDGQSSGGGKGGSAPSNSSDDDSQAALKAAKACAPYFRGIATKIQVLSPNSQDQLVQVSPDTVLAVHLRGNQQTLSMNLGQSQGFAGLCLILTGNETAVDISSASSIRKLVYAGRGNQSQGHIEMLNGATISEASIDLGGNQPQLTLNGVNAALCSKAKISGNGAVLNCSR